MAIGQIGFWGGMMGHSTHEAMGNNFYASKDVELFMQGVATRPKESLTAREGITQGGTREERIEQLRQQQSGGQSPEELRARLIELRRLQKEQQGGGTATQTKPHLGFTNKGKPHDFVPREKALKNLLKEAKNIGASIHSDEEAVRYLDWRAKQMGVDPESIHAVTLGDDIFVRPQYAENVRVLREELVHVYQQRDGADITKVVELEIDARLELIRNRNNWGITNNEVREMIQEIRQMRKTGRY